MAPVLGGILEPGGGDLLHLVAEQVDLPGPGAGVPTEGLELGVERAHRRSFVAVAGPCVQRRRVMRNKQHARVEAAKQIENPGLRDDVERSSWFIRDNQGRSASHCLRD